MLRKADIRYFRSCVDVVLDGLEGVTALIGRNGTGKSNVLRAINWAAMLGSGRYATSERTSLSIVADVVLEFSIRNTVVRYRAQTAFVDDKPESGPPELFLIEHLHAVRDGEQMLVASKDPKGLRLREGDTERVVLADSSFSMLPSIARITEPFEWADLCIGALVYLAGVNYYPLNELNREESATNPFQIISAQEFLDWFRSPSVRAPESGGEAVYRILAMHLFTPNRLDEFKQLLGDNGLNLIKGIEIQALDPSTGAAKKEPVVIDGRKLSRFYYVEFEPANSAGGRTSSVTFDDLSHGTRRVMDLVAAVLYDRSTLMLVEHPEDAIHIGLLAKIMDLLRTYTVTSQVIMATHSRVILNSLRVQQLRFVTMEKGQTKIYRLNGEKLKAAERYITTEDEDGGSVGDFVETFEESLP